MLEVIIECNASCRDNNKHVSSVIVYRCDYHYDAIAPVAQEQVQCHELNVH